MARHYVYQGFSESGTLLYVGITNNLRRRLWNHTSEKAWWTEVTRVTVWEYETRAEALAVEHAVIAYGRPKYNILPGQTPINVIEGEVIEDHFIEDVVPIPSAVVQRRWIVEQLNDGRTLTGADIDNHFNVGKSRNGARLLRAVLKERNQDV